MLQAMFFAPLAETIATVQQTIQQTVQQITQLPSQIVQQTQNIVQQIAEALTPSQPEPEITYPPIEESVTAEAPAVLSHELELVKQKYFGELDILALPKALRDLVFKFPVVGSALEKAGVTKASDIERLRGVAFSFPTLSASAGIGTL